MNMRQQRITTSQQEVYLIFLMDNTEFAASRIKDGDCCCIFFRLFPLSVRILFFRELCVGNVLSFHVQFFSSFLPHAQLTGESKYEEKWKELTKMLNNTLGPKKTVEEWKMVKSSFF